MTKYRVIIAVVAVLAMAAFAGCITDAKHQKIVDDVKKQLSASEDEKDAAKKKVAELDKSLADSNKEKEVQAGRIKSLEDNLTAKQQQINDLNNEKSKLTETKKKLEEKTENYENIKKSLENEINNKSVELSELKGKLTIKMKDKILFSSGSIKLNEDGKAALKRLADALNTMKDKGIQVEGHTDNDPVGPNAPYADNWDLSVKRALAVVKLLIDDGIDPTRLEASGLGQFQPIAPNDTPENKSLNRRIEIELVPLNALSPMAIQSVPDTKAKAKK
ncbi:MAG: OmpA family protein [Myxococcota bacterium]|jgi:chemotaxis protein MotB